jgi:hypothetical protein
MGNTSFFTGLVVGSAATAVLIYYVFLQDDSADDTNHDGTKKKQQNTFLLQQQILRRRIKRRGSAQRVTPEISFFTDMLSELWPHIKIAAADKVQAKVEPYFQDMPAPMNSCRFVKVDLGDTPMTMNNMIVHPIQNETVQWDFDMEWDGDCDIQLQADFIGKFGIKKLKLFGRMAIILKPLTNELPVVSAIQYSFINMPHVDLQFTGLASVAELSVLNDAIKGAIRGAMLSSCLPNRRLYKMAHDNNYLDTYLPPVGVLRLTIESGRGFVTEKRLLGKDDVPDVYLNVTLGATLPTSPNVWRTKTITDQCNPVWNVSKDFLLWDRTQEITIHAWDEDGGPLNPDDELGIATVSVTELLLSPKRRKELPLLYRGRDTGACVMLSCVVGDWTADLESLSSTMDTTRNGSTQNGGKGGVDGSHEICGLLVIIINRAFDLPLQRKTATTFVKTKFAGKEYNSNLIYDYPGYYDALNPVYDSSFTIPFTSEMEVADDATVELELLDAGKPDNPSVVGTTSVRLAELNKYPGNTMTDTRRITSDGATLQFRISLSGVSIPKHHSTIFNEVVDFANSLAPGTSSPTKPLPSSQRSNTKDLSLARNGVIGELGTVRMTI